MVHPGWLPNKLIGLELPNRGKLSTKVFGLQHRTLVLLAPAENGKTVWPNVGSPAIVSMPTTHSQTAITGTIIERKLKPLPLIFVRLDQDIPLIAAVQKRPNKVIAVASGKGGTGKTFLALNIAWGLALQGFRTLVVDLDLGTANLSVALGLAPRHNLSDVIEGTLELDQVICTISHNLALIPGAAKSKEYASLSPWQFHRLVTGLAQLEEKWDYLILDTGAGLSPNTTTFLYLVDYILMVINPEPASLLDGYGLLKAIADQFWTPKTGLVVNRILDPEEADECATRFSGAARQFLDLTVQYLGGIHEDRDILDSLKVARPVLAAYPSSTASSDLKNVTDKLMVALNDTQISYRRLRPSR